MVAQMENKRHCRGVRKRESTRERKLLSSSVSPVAEAKAELAVLQTATVSHQTLILPQCPDHVGYRVTDKG